MSVKETVIQRIQNLPEDITAKEMYEKIDFILGVQEAIDSSKRGERLPATEVRKKISGWASR